LREDGINQIAAECLGNELNLKVNGQKLLSVVDDAFQVGKVGLIVETGAEGTAAIVFKDFRLSSAKMKVYLDMIAAGSIKLSLSSWQWN